MTDMTPDAISTYFGAAERDDLDALIACFTDDALVTDERKTWRGHTAIRDWRENTATVYQYTLELLGIEPVDDRTYAVRTRLEGNFPGGVVELVYRFTLRDGLISALHIAP
jgi:ketosteroid isomerase-like protein